MGSLPAPSHLLLVLFVVFQRQIMASVKTLHRYEGLERVGRGLFGLGQTHEPLGLDDRLVGETIRLEVGEQAADLAAYLVGAGQVDRSAGPQRRPVGEAATNRARSPTLRPGADPFSQSIGRRHWAQPLRGREPRPH